MTKAIDSFSGQYEFLSNFHPSPIVMDGLLYPTVEHAFQAAKTTDVDKREKIRFAATASDAKKLGGPKGIVTIDQNWDSQKLDIMSSLVQKKFAEHLDLKLKLLLTGEAELIEGNTWRDQFWGVTKDGVGENHLGKILMSIRTKIRNTEGSAAKVFETFLNEKSLGFLAIEFSKLFENSTDPEVVEFIASFTEKSSQ